MTSARLELGHEGSDESVNREEPGSPPQRDGGLIQPEAPLTTSAWSISGLLSDSVKISSPVESLLCP